MNVNSKIEDVPKNLDVLIKDKLKSMLNEFGELCDTLEKLGITFRSDFKSSDSNSFLKGDNISDNKTKVIVLVPDTLPVSEITCSSIIHSDKYNISTMDSEVVWSFNKEAETANSIMDCYDNEADALSGDINIDNVSDCGSEASSTVVNLSNSNSDEFLPSEEIPKTDSELLSTKKYQTKGCRVENYSDGESVKCFSETSSNIVKFEYQVTDASATSVPTIEDKGDMLRKLLSSDGSQKAMNVFNSLHSQIMCRDLKSQNSDLKPCASDLRLSDSDKDTSTNKLYNSIFGFLTIGLETTLVETKPSHSEYNFINNKVISVNADETRENEMFDIQSDLELQNVICAGMPITAGEDFCQDSNRGQCEKLKSSDSDSESHYSALYFSDSDEEKCSSEVTSSQHKQKNVMHRMELRSAMNNIDGIPDFPQEETDIVEDSFHNDFGISNDRVNSFNSDKMKLKKRLPATYIVSDEEWSRLPLCVKYNKNPKLTLYEFLSNTNTIGFSDSGYDLYHSDWKVSKIDIESQSFKKSCKVFKMLSAIRDIINKHSLSPSEFDPNFCCTEGFQDGGILIEESLQHNASLDNGQKSSVSLHEPTDSQPDRLDNIFKITGKGDPIKNYEIPSYATADPEIELDITDSLVKYTEDEMPINSIDEKENNSEECDYDIDNNSVIQFEYINDFLQDNRTIYAALIMDYFNTAASLNLFFIKKAKDVSIEGYDLHRSILHCLDDDLGYLSAKLMVARNEWTKQLCEIHCSLREYEQWRSSSRGFYYMGMVRVCIELTEILLKHCLEKQLELEEYERNLIFYH